MTKLIHCHHCHEDINEADWEANASCCPGCGQVVQSPDFWNQSDWGFNAFRDRIELRTLLRRTGTPAGSVYRSQAVPVMTSRRVYA